MLGPALSDMTLERLTNIGGYTYIGKEFFKVCLSVLGLASFNFH
jgi:hypothetical protein